MKVVLLDWIVDGHHIGYASYLTRYLVKQGDEVVFVGRQPNESVERLREEGADVQYVIGRSNGAKFGGSTWHRLSQMSRGIRYSFALADSLEADAVHHLYLERNEIPLYMQMRKLRKKHSWKLFATLFWPYFIHTPNDKVGFIKQLYHRANRWILGRMLKQGIIEGLFVHTERMKQKLIRVYGAAAGQRLIVIPDPVERLAKGSQEEARSSLGLPRDKSVILFFGGLRWDKGPDILFDALPLVDGDWVAIIAGEPGDIGRTEVERCQEELQEPKRLIARLAIVPDGDMPLYFAAADVVVLPYRRAFKGTSGVLQNAAAAGKPVIAANVGEVGPTTLEYGLGIVVEPESPSALAEGIREFLAGKDALTEEVRPRALQYAEAHDWRVMARRVREAYLSSGER